MASQITSNLTVCSTACSNKYQRKHQSSTLLSLYEVNPLVTVGFPSQSASIVQAFPSDDITMVCSISLQEGLRLAQAVFLGLIISYFEEGSHMSTFEMYMYALGWSLSYLFIIILDNIAFHKSFYLGLKMRVACTSLIYRKVGEFLS